MVARAMVSSAWMGYDNKPNSLQQTLNCQNHCDRDHHQSGNDKGSLELLNFATCSIPF